MQRRGERIVGKEGKILSEHGALLGKEGWGRRPQQVVGGLKSSEQKTGWQGVRVGERERPRDRERETEAVTEQSCNQTLTPL